MKYFKNFDLFEQRITDRVVSANDLLNSVDSDDMIDLGYPYKEMLGDISKTFTLFLHGGPGSGKTTFLLKFANDLAVSHGKVLYVSSEEFGSVTLVKKLKEMMGKEDEEEFKLPENLYFAKGLTDLTDYQFVILDSVNDLGLEIEDFKELKKIYQDTAFILILQNTKAGDYRGGKDWEHEVDIAGDVEEGILTIFKNRFGVYSKYDFFNDKFIKDKDEE